MKRDDTNLIAGEFLATLFLLLGGVLFDQPAKGSNSATVVGQHLVRATAACGVFGVLALMSNGERVGRIATAFGGLVLLAVVFSERTWITGFAKGFTRGVSPWLPPAQ